MVKMKCPWKEASTIILTAPKKTPVNSNWNYELLTLKRSSKSSFMPNSYVFPGGITEPFDSDKVWLDYFSFFSLDLSTVLKFNGKVPPILANETGKIPKLLSLKITAVRETFEETGILLCFDKNQKSGNSSKWLSSNSFQDLHSWRKKVQTDSREFFNMCQNYNCCPDVGNIHLWSNWLTPTSMGKKRFDTAFFISCLIKSPLAIADEMEIEKLSWTAPNELMRLCHNNDINLPPPQVYEIGRILQFKEINDLSNFALTRCTQGCERWMPIQIKTLDGLVSILPGDDAYNLSDYYTSTEPKKITLTTEQFRNQSNVSHRMEFVGKFKTKIIVKNYNPTNDHVLPITEC